MNLEITQLYGYHKSVGYWSVGHHDAKIFVAEVKRRYMRNIDCDRVEQCYFKKVEGDHPQRPQLVWAVETDPTAFPVTIFEDYDES
jgi:hypothetical protein